MGQIWEFLGFQFRTIRQDPGIEIADDARTGRAILPTGDAQVIGDLDGAGAVETLDPPIAWAYSFQLLGMNPFQGSVDTRCLVAYRMARQGMQLGRSLKGR